MAGSQARQHDHVRSIALFGAPLDTDNLGVSALGLATIANVARRIPTAAVTLFDNGRGQRPLHLALGGQRVRVIRRGAWISRRLYRPESLWTMHACSMVAPWANANVRTIDRSSVVLDISGGDSFTDLYGERRLQLVTLPKRIALRRRRPLLLLPQTYGPFRDATAASLAAEIVAGADGAWARDAHSYERLRELLGNRFDASRHRLGADVAFALPSTDPGHKLGRIGRWLDDDRPVIGVNVSGLLSDPAGSARRRFGLACDYAATMARIVRRLLSEEGDVRVVLVPHVRSGGRESDDPASERLLAGVTPSTRVATLPRSLGVDEVKHVIGRLDWFVGARMHSTIAALSSRVPVAAIAYSDKFQGVFDACGVGHRVLDARRLDTDDLTDATLEAWRHRAVDRDLLRDHLPAVEGIVAQQFDDIAETIAAGDRGERRRR